MHKLKTCFTHLELHGKRKSSLKDLQILLFYQQSCKGWWTKACHSLIKPRVAVYREKFRDQSPYYEKQQIYIAESSYAENIINICKNSFLKFHLSLSSSNLYVQVCKLRVKRSHATVYRFMVYVQAYYPIRCYAHVLMVVVLLHGTRTRPLPTPPPLPRMLYTDPRAYISKYRWLWSRTHKLLSFQGTWLDALKESNPRQSAWTVALHWTRPIYGVEWSNQQ